MAFDTAIPGYLLLGESNVRFDTASITTADLVAWGEITKLDFARKADMTELPNHLGGNLAVILHKLRLELDIEIIIATDVAMPGPGDQIVFPGADGAASELKGNILGEVKLMWANATAKKLSFRAARWDYMGDVTATTIPND